MSAKLEICLYVGMLQTRFEVWDEVKITLENGRTVEGTILPMESTRCFEVNTKKGVVPVYPEDIKYCVEVKESKNNDLTEDLTMNIIKVDEIDEQSTDELHRRFVQRYRKEKGRLLTDHESNLCWWAICGVVMRDGYEAGKEFVDAVGLE